MSGRMVGARKKSARMEEFLDLQTRLYIRWINNKISVRNMSVSSLDDLSSGLALIALIEILTGNTCQRRLVKRPKLKMQKVNNANAALEFIFQNGVWMSLKPSAENIVDADPILVLGLIWAIMNTFMKFQDEDEEGSAEHKEISVRDQLLQWVQHQLIDYEQLQVNDMTNSFDNGMVLCALVHKFLPQLIPFDELDAKNSEENLRLAFEGAEQLFGLEQYITPNELQKMDDKCMVVYVSDYYHGLKKVRKILAAVRRINKLIKYTSQNDQLRDEYAENSAKLVDQMVELQAKMDDHVIDNTFDGAKQRKEDFYYYKTKTKGSTVDSAYLQLESLYGKLSFRLKQHNRDPFFPEAGTELDELQAIIKELEHMEDKKKVALHKELSRQYRLKKLDGLHSSTVETLQGWCDEKQIYLEYKDNIQSVGQSLHELNTLDSFLNEKKIKSDVTLNQLQDMNLELKKEQFESLDQVNLREVKLNNMLDNLSHLALEKKKVLEDHRDREKMKERLEQWDTKHMKECEKLKAWQANKRNYLNTKEEIKSVNDADLALAILASYDAEKGDVHSIKVPRMQMLGSEILSQKYKTKYSECSFLKSDELKAREQSILDVFPELDDLYTKKLEVLKDDLAREKFKEDVIKENKLHINLFTQIMEWINEQTNYLEQKDVANSVENAQANLVFITEYEDEKKAIVSTNVKKLNELGESVLSKQFRGLTNYQFESPDEIKEREEKVSTTLDILGGLEGPKRDSLEDDLKREQFRENIRQKNELHKSKFADLELWIGEKQTYLQNTEQVDSVIQAQENLATFASYQKSKEEMIDGEDAAFRDLGKKTIEDKYDGLTTYIFDNPNSIRDREDAISRAWTSLDEFAQVKEDTLKDDLSRELFRENILQENGKHTIQQHALLQWCDEAVAYLDKIEQVESIADAEMNLADLKTFCEEKEDTLRGDVVSLKDRGGRLISDKYHTKLSSYAFPSPHEPRSREMEVDTAFEKIETMIPQKKFLLEDDLRRELFKEELRQNNAQHQVMFEELKMWVAEKMEYLHKKEEVDSIRKAQENIMMHETYEEEKLIKTTGNVSAWKSLGQSIINTIYETSYSKWRWQTPDEIVEREKSVDDDWGMLDILSATKKEVLDDDLGRELFKEKLRQENEQHKRKYEDLLSWIASKKDYLEKKEECDSIKTAEKNLYDCLAYKDDKNIMSSGFLVAFKKLGTDIISDNYGTRFSSWIWPSPDKIRTREREIEEAWLELDTLCKAKIAYLEDHLGREEFKDKIIQQSELHTKKFEELKQWVEQKKNYLSTREAVDSISAAEFNLNTLGTYGQEKEIVTGGKVAVFKALGQEIRDAEYSTELSQWNFPESDELEENETKIDEDWTMLDDLSATKKEYIDDDLARELFKEKLRQQNEEHIKIYDKILLWCNQKTDYLNKIDSINSIAEAQNQIRMLEVSDEEKKNLTQGTIAALKKLGAEIIESKYQSSHSDYSFPVPDEITSRETKIDDELTTLDNFRETKLTTVQDELKQQQTTEKLRQDAEQHKTKYNELVIWFQEKKNYLACKEYADSIQTGQINITNFEAYEEGVRIMIASSIANLKSSGEALIALHYEAPDEINDHITDIDRKIAMLNDMAQVKKEILMDDLAREEFRDKLRQDNENHIMKYKSICSWVKKKKEYLNTKEPAASVKQTQVNLAILNAYMVEKTNVTNGALSVLKAMGRAITTARYQTKFSSYVFPASETITDREKQLADAWTQLDNLSKEKQNVLNDDLSRGQFKEKLRLCSSQHAAQYQAITNWINDSLEYLNTRDGAMSINNAVHEKNAIQVWESDRLDQTNFVFANQTKICEYIKSAKYQTSLSSYVFENIDEVITRQNRMVSGWERLKSLSIEKNQFINHDLDCERKKEELRLKFGKIAGDFEQWEKSTIKSNDQSHFGFDLDEIKKNSPKHFIAAQNIRTEGSRNIQAAKEVLGELKNVYGDENKNGYTQDTLATLEERYKRVEGSLEKKDENQKNELTRLRSLDDLCKKLAKLVVPFINHIKQSKTRAIESAQDLNGQLSLVSEMLASIDGKKITGQLSAINDMQAKLDMEGITDNHHTTLNAFDVTFELEQFKQFLTTKKENLTSSIKLTSVKGTTPGEIEEIKARFEKWDKNDNGVLNASELRQYLCTVGDERGIREIDGLMKEYGGEDGMDLEGFEEFWINKLAGPETREEIIDSFAIINGERPPSVEIAEQQEAIRNNKPAKPIRCTYMIKSSRMKLWMSEEDQKYIAETATAVQEDGGGSDYFSDLAGYYYQGWVDDVYCR